MPKTILAVAVGETPKEVTLNTANPDLSGVRPYIATGLIPWLASQTRADPPQPDNNPPRYQIPGDYSIIYRERPVGNLASAFQDNAALQADLWFCMSTSIAKAADGVAKAQTPPWTKPIVAIVSDPFGERFGDNFCGVSASRDRLAIRCLRQFKRRVPSVRNIFVLHREGYGPSERARQWVGKKIVAGVVSIADSDDTQAMQNKITTGIVNSTKPNKGVLVLPADRFFGVATLITQWTGAIPTFWSTPDFPPAHPPGGGYGYSQKKCGQFMAERVAIIWKNQADGASDPMPDPKWVAMDQDDLEGTP
jgi:hypothetical protein